MDEKAERGMRLEQLVGVGASKRTYYSQYREQERRLDRAILSISSISDALCDTTRGVPVLARAIVRVAAQHFEAERAVLALYDDAEQCWGARWAPDGSLLTDDLLPPVLEAALNEVAARRCLLIGAEALGPKTCGAPLFLEGELIGALVVMLGPQIEPDARELSVLTTLANQAAAAVRNARLYEESERLRAEAEALYAEACRQKMELEQKNRQLASARRRLAVAYKNDLLYAERNRIARELHDSVAQYIITIGMNLEWCRAQLPEGNPVHTRISGAKELARSAVTQMRSAIFELSTIQDARPALPERLSNFVAEFGRLAGLNVRLRVRGAEHALSGEVEHALLRITQEALFNVYKHAQASRASVELRFQAASVELLVSDDGIGIGADPVRPGNAEADSHPHRGLQNMRARAHELCGTCQIARRRGGGTQVRVTLPVLVIAEAPSDA